MAEVYIYGLHEEGSDEIRYVGQTANVKARLSAHLSDYTKHGNAKATWVADCKSKGITIKLTVLEECGLSESIEKEEYWIEKLDQHGHRLTNTKQPIRFRREKEALTNCALPDLMEAKKGEELTKQQLIDHIKKVCNTVGSQSSLASMLNVAPSFLSDVINGRREPTATLIDALGFKEVIRYYPRTKQ